MSNSQKFKGFTVVPWYNTAEWRNVYELIFSEKSTKEDLKTALRIMTSWQKRIAHIPSGIEGTLCILEAFLIDNTELSERQYQILCSSSIMRFLNICVAHRASINSFTKTARDNCIPDWVISIRHDFAHSQKLPSVPLLDMAIKEAFKWLENTYWLPEYYKMCDNMISGVATVDAKVGTCVLETPELMGLYCNVFVYDALNLCYDEFIQDKLEHVNASSKISKYPKAIRYILEQNIEEVCEYEWDKCIDEIMHSHFFIISPNTLKDKKGNYVSHYTNLAALINLLEKHRKLPHLMRELLQFCANERETIDTRTGAAQWLDEILKGLLRFRKKKPASDEKNGIHFKQLHKETVTLIKRLEQLVLTNVPEEFRKYFIKNFVILMGIENVSGFVKELNRRMVTYPSDEFEDSLKMQQDHRNYEDSLRGLISSTSEMNAMIVEDTLDSSETLIARTEPAQHRRFRLVPDSTPFETCAIGVIPPQWTA